MQTANPMFEGWVLVELMGHRRLTGFGHEVEMFGTRVLRLDIALPEGEESLHQFYTGQAVFCVTPLSVEDATKHASDNLDTLRRMGLRPWPKAPTFGLVVAANYYDDNDDMSDGQEEDY
jgi:hypothetical protein